MCNPHYQKWYKYGNPLIGGTYEEGRSGENNPNYRGGKTSHPLYDVYHQMIGRCHTASHPRYADYGGRDINVCWKWRQDFWSFVEDMGECPEGMWLDRIDNDGDYSPENCRWTTPHISNINRRTSGIEDRERDSKGRLL